MQYNKGEYSNSTTQNEMIKAPKFEYVTSLDEIERLAFKLIKKEKRNSLKLFLLLMEASNHSEGFYPHDYGLKSLSSTLKPLNTHLDKPFLIEREKKPDEWHKLKITPAINFNKVHVNSSEGEKVQRILKFALHIANAKSSISIAPLLVILAVYTKRGISTYDDLIHYAYSHLPINSEKFKNKRNFISKICSQLSQLGIITLNTIPGSRGNQKYVEVAYEL